MGKPRFEIEPACTQRPTTDSVVLQAAPSERRSSFLLCSMITPTASSRNSTAVTRHGVTRHHTQDLCTRVSRMGADHERFTQDPDAPIVLHRGHQDFGWAHGNISCVEAGNTGGDSRCETIPRQTIATFGGRSPGAKEVPLRVVVDRLSIVTC